MRRRTQPSPTGTRTYAGRRWDARQGPKRWPSNVAAPERLPLTDREREIVMLIGQGLSNRDIATRLTLSVRTVESHIYKAMAKTGTSNRDELAGLLPSRRE